MMVFGSELAFASVIAALNEHIPLASAQTSLPGAASCVSAVVFTTNAGPGLGVGVGVGVGVFVGVLVGVSVGVDVGVLVGVAVGVAVGPESGPWTIKFIGSPVLKKPTVASTSLGGSSESKRKL
jgi:hypothetical protein